MCSIYGYFLDVLCADNFIVSSSDIASHWSIVFKKVDHLRIVILETIFCLVKITHCWHRILRTTLAFGKCTLSSRWNIYPLTKFVGLCCLWKLRINLFPFASRYKRRVLELFFLFILFTFLLLLFLLTSFCATVAPRWEFLLLFSSLCFRWDHLSRRRTICMKLILGWMDCFFKFGRQSCNRVNHRI